jgi:hypothetical protein
MKLLEKTYCKNNPIYIFSYFLFILMNVIGNFVLVVYLNNKQYHPVIFLIFSCFFIFFWGLISRFICIKCDKDDLINEHILPDNTSDDLKKEYYSF